MSIELVVATYDRSYDWIEKVNKEVTVTVYTKDTNTNKESEIVIPLNVGRDVHTFFYHIVNRYDSLSEVTFFSQDFGLEHVDNYYDVINGDVDCWTYHAKQHFEGYWVYQRGLYTGWEWHAETDSNGRVLRCDQSGLPNHPNLPILETWNKLFETQCPSTLEYVPGGHFSITKEQLHIRPKSFYQTILQILETEYVAPWVFERLEPYIFNSKYKIKSQYE